MGVVFVVWIHVVTTLCLPHSKMDPPPPCVITSLTTGWYTEKYRRDEDDIDGQIKRMYVSDIRQAHDKLPQMTATIRGQDVRLDDRMNKLVWGGKAHMEQNMSSGSAFGGGIGGGGGSKSGRYELEDDDDLTSAPQRIDISQRQAGSDDDDNSVTKKKKKRRKKKGKKTTTKADKEKKDPELNSAAAERKKLIVQSTVVGVTLGAVAVAAFAFVGGGSAAKR
jgi:hypothetical protein